MSALRRRPARRAIAALLAGVYLVLAIGAGHHTGDHGDSPLAWLPIQFHIHHLTLDAESSTPPPALGDHCLACQLSRLSVRFTPPAPAPPAARPAVRTHAVRDAAAPRSAVLPLPEARGPPAA